MVLAHVKAWRLEVAPPHDPDLFVQHGIISVDVLAVTEYEAVGKARAQAGHQLGIAGSRLDVRVISMR